MTLEERIKALLALAEPLRSLHDADAGKESLTALVDEINGLRALQAEQAMTDSLSAWIDDMHKEGEDVIRNTEEGADAVIEPPVKRGPGRPRKNPA